MHLRQLLKASTSLMAVGVISTGAANAEGIELSVGGYMNNFFAIGDVESDSAASPGTDSSGDFNETGHFSDGEIHFHGEAALDNGITVGAQVELESFTSGDQIDENYAYVRGSFGEVRLGSDNTAAYLMQFAAPNVGVPINSGWVTSFVAPPANHSAQFRHPGLSTYVDFGNDENTATYFTPRFAGFQLGASYTPTFTGAGDGANFPTNRIGAEGNHGVSVGANYVETLAGVDVSVSGGYRSILDENPSTFGDTPEQYSAGINLGYAGVTIGGSWALEESELPNGAEAPTDGQSFDVGASYAFGAWSVGATWLYSESEGGNALSGTGNDGEDELNAIEGGVAYTLGPGVTTSLSVLYAQLEDEGGVENEGILGIAGLALSF
jgi:predicted porin